MNYEFPHTLPVFTLAPLAPCICLEKSVSSCLELKSFNVRTDIHIHTHTIESGAYETGNKLTKIKSCNHYYYYTKKAEEDRSQVGQFYYYYYY